MMRFQDLMTAVLLVIFSVVVALWAGREMFTGESYPPPKLTEKAVYYVRVPVPSAISP